MIPPQTALEQLLAGLILGAALGCADSLLAPLGRRHRHLADLLLMIPVFWTWLVLSFQICRGDPRMSCFAAMAAGAILWNITAGQVLKPVFFRLWDGFFGLCRKIFRPFLKIFKKIWGFIKKYLHLRKNGLQ